MRTCHLNAAVAKLFYFGPASTGRHQNGACNAIWHTDKNAIENGMPAAQKNTQLGASRAAHGFKPTEGSKKHALRRAVANRNAHDLRFNVQTSNAKSHFTLRQANTRRVAGAALRNASTSTCGCRIAFVKTQRVAKRLKGNPTENAGRHLARMPANTVAANARGITDGAKTGHGES